MEFEEWLLTCYRQMRQYQYDPEMMADLYYGISREFLESPDERITWLESLASYHKQVLFINFLFIS